jgi:catechol 2,3-dioxygenase-like lactoylglutathione lyase family enzyme
MFNIRGIDHINMNVKSFSDSIEFYKKVFNMEVLEDDISRNSGQRFVIVGIPNVISLCLYENKDFNLENNEIGHIGINIVNFDGVKKSLEKMGVQYFYGGVIDWEKSKSIYIQDPSGHEIELTKNFGGGF